ncbi:MAG: alpha/beta hydrolase, partial [Oscillospiraceae bacterium]|nr:alpha/beta hydrolase [Oscillospiraceae bacterium]
MWEIKTESIRIDSACPGAQVQGWLVSCPDVEPKAILQISHGMCEYSGRYLDFAGFMARQGYRVCLHDHLGHGETSDLPGGLDGYFGPSHGAAYVL